MSKKNSHCVEEQLQSVAKDLDSLVTIDYCHNQELRRCLLNSSYFSAHCVVRWYSRLSSLPKKMIVMSTGVGVVAISLFVFSAYNNDDLIASDTNPYIATVNAQEFPEEYLQEMYKYGYLSYSHDNPDGCRVYKARYNGEVMMLHDDKPYIINTVLAN